MRQIVRQSIVNLKYLGGGAKWCFDSYFSLFKQWNQYYQLKSYKLFFFGVK